MKNVWKRIVAGAMLLVMMLTFLPTNVVYAATFKKGSKGTSVQYLQQNLAFLGCSPGSADGSYGAKTVAAVNALQKKLHLEVTGQIDDALDALIKETVRDVQKYLKFKNYYSGDLDGIKGNQMATGYKKLQKELGYTQTGVFDLNIAQHILNDNSFAEELKGLQEFVDRCNDVYEDIDAKFMKNMEKCIHDLELIQVEGLAKSSVTSSLANAMLDITTWNNIWSKDSKPKTEEAVKYSTDLLLTLYNSIVSENMRLHKLKEIESTHLVSCQSLIDSYFEDAYQSLEIMSKSNSISKNNRKRTETLISVLKDFQQSLPTCNEVYDYAVKMLKVIDGTNIVIHDGTTFFVCKDLKADKDLKSEYVFNQNNYKKFVKPGRGNVGCTATALAISYSIYNNMLLLPDNEDIAWDNAKYTMVMKNREWYPHMKSDTNFCKVKAEERLRYIYDNFIVADIPVVIRLERVTNPQNGDNGHSVVVVGVRIDADINNLTYDDLLVANPDGGVIHTLQDSFKNGTYRLSSGWYLHYPKKAE